MSEPDSIIGTTRPGPFAAEAQAWARIWSPDSINWWSRAAAVAIRRGSYRVIPTRDGTRPYLLRCWLSGANAKADGEVFESSESVLLHHFLEPDDDGALHDHPWSFTTTILAGGYEEALPPEGWTGEVGPPIDACIARRRAGDHIHHAAHDLHAVAAILPGTWTMVATGPRVRDWCFWPPGAAPVPWRTYLARTAAT